MIKREIETELKKLLKEYPVVVVLGPRQSGKTTLVKSLKNYSYCNLEIPENRDYATEDPKSFLAQFKRKVILDEIQRVPLLLSYIQANADENPLNGRYILTGSHQLELKQAVTQSLAGRAAIIHLLPFSIAELEKAKVSYDNFEDYAYKGFLPRIYDQNQRPGPAYSNYYQTYVERDVRQLINLKDVSLFEKFLKLLAGRVGQVFDYCSLGNDVGVDTKTIKNWLSILEASFIIFKLPPYFENFGKRAIKSPKYYFIEIGLLSFLLGIEKPDQVTRDPLVGNIFENLIVIECLKTRYNKGKISNLYFYRDSNGNEVDIIFQKGQYLSAIEVKSSATYNKLFFKTIDKLGKITGKLKHRYVVYSGENKNFNESEKKVINFKNIKGIF